MASSGTFSWSPTTAELIDEAFERARIDPATITVYQQFSARRSLNAILTDWSNKGINLWTVEQRTLTLVAGTASYTLPAEVIDVLEAVLRRSGKDTPMMPMGREEYLGLPDKTLRGRPDRYFTDRQAAAVVLKPWFVPENSTDTIIYSDFRSLQDVKADMAQNVDTPKRWLDALFDELAVRVHRKWGSDRTTTDKEGNVRRSYDGSLEKVLREVAAASFNVARMEDRERVPTRLRVKFS
jgi:hypothetical protein